MDFIFLKSKKRGNEEFGTVYARVRVKGYNKKFATGFTIRDIEWERYHTLQYISSRLMTSIGIKYGDFAKVLSQIKASLEEDFDPKTAPSIIRSIKASILNGEELTVKESAKNKKSMLLVDYLNKYKEELQTGVRFKKGTSKKVSDGYIERIISILSRVKRYERDRRKTISLDDVTMDFQRDLIKWYRDNGLSTNTISGDLRGLSTVLKSALEAKLTRVDEFRNSQFVPKGEKVDHIFLTPEQITTMYELDLSSMEVIADLVNQSKMKKKDKEETINKLTELTAKHIECTRDIFIVGCLSGQRFSDFSRINKEMITTINDSPFICLIQEKTKAKVIFPMDKRIRTILDKYNGAFPKMYLQEFNRNIKLIAELLGWTFKAKINEERLGSKTSTRFCDLISSHTARRTFATNAYAAGVPLSSIMAITGHSSEKNLRLYLKLQAEDKAIIAAKDFENIIITQ